MIRPRLGFGSRVLIFYTLIIIGSSFNTTAGAKVSNVSTPADSPLAMVYKFIYNNENLCGDMFADAKWLPAHRLCKLECQLGEEICQIQQIQAADALKKQRCFKLPAECKRRLKIILGIGVGFIEQKPTKPLNESLINFAALPPRMPHALIKNSTKFVAPINSKITQYLKYSSNENKPDKDIKSSRILAGKTKADSFLLIQRAEFARQMANEIGNKSTLVVEIPRQYAHIPTLAPPTIPPYMTTTFFDTLTTTTLPPIGGGLESFSSDKSLLPLPAIVLSSSTFPPPRPPTTPLSSFVLPDSEIRRTTVPHPQILHFIQDQRQLHKSSGALNRQKSETMTTVMANKWSDTVTDSPSREVNNVLQRQYENIFVKQTTPPPQPRTVYWPAFSTVWMIETTTTRANTAQSSHDYEENEANFIAGFDAGNIFAIESKPPEQKMLKESAKISAKMPKIVEDNHSVEIPLSSNKAYDVDRELPERFDFAEPDDKPTKSRQESEPFTGNPYENAVMFSKNSKEFSSAEPEQQPPRNRLSVDNEDFDKRIHIFGPPTNAKPYEDAVMIRPPSAFISMEDESPGSNDMNLSPQNNEVRQSKAYERMYAREEKLSGRAMVLAAKQQKNGQKNEKKKKIIIHRKTTNTIADEASSIKKEPKVADHLRDTDDKEWRKQNGSQKKVEFSTETLDEFSSSKPWWLWQEHDRKQSDGQETVDRSVRCCQWALDGLCDRSWQRVRLLCPKSCGTVVCSQSSCNRVINVDVIDCYEQRRRLKAYGTLLNHFDSSVQAQFLKSVIDGKPENTSPVPDVPIKHPDDNDGDDMTFAIEDEIKRFNSFNKNQKLSSSLF